MQWMFMPLKRYAEFGGRSRRMEFWLYMLGLFILYMILAMVIVVVSVGAAASMSSSSGSGMSNAGGLMGMMAGMGIALIFFAIIALGLFIPTLAVQIRRLHDSNRSGWWLWLYWGPYFVAIIISVMGAAAQSQELSMFSLVFSLASWIGSIVLIVFWCLPGTNGPNRYGQDPLGGSGNLSQTFQ